MSCGEARESRGVEQWRGCMVVKDDGMEPRLEVDGFFVVYVGVRWPSEAGARSGHGVASE